MGYSPNLNWWAGFLVAINTTAPNSPDALIPRLDDGDQNWQDLTSTAGVAASFVGTANYMSPERALGKDPETKTRNARMNIRKRGGRVKDEHLKCLV